MPVVPDSSGNGYAVPEAHLGGQHDISALSPREEHLISALSNTSQPLGPFNPLTRYVRVAPEGDCHYAVGANPTATANSPYIADTAIEYIKVTYPEKIAFIQDASATDPVTVTEMR